MIDLPAALIAFASLLNAQPGLVGKIARRDLCGGCRITSRRLTLTACGFFRLPPQTVANERPAALGKAVAPHVIVVSP